MSAKLCKEPGCGKLIVFAKDVETGDWVPLSNQAVIYREVKFEAGVHYVERDKKALLLHFQNCTHPGRFSRPKPERHFSEPKEAPLINEHGIVPLIVVGVIALAFIVGAKIQKSIIEKTLICHEPGVEATFQWPSMSVPDYNRR